MPALASPASEPLRLPSLHKHTAFLPESTSPMGGEEGLLLLYNNEGTKRDMLTVCLSSTSTLVNLVKVFSEWYNAYHLYLTSTWLSRLAYPDPGESLKTSIFSFPDRWFFLEMASLYWRWGAVPILTKLWRASCIMQEDRYWGLI